MRMIRTPVLHRWVRWGCAAAFAALALGCATPPEWQKPGTPASQIAQDMGQPVVRSELPDGGERWLYSRQPMGQQVYHFDFDRDQRLSNVRQVLEPASFYQLRVDVATRDEVYRFFGAPALIEHVWSFKGDIWTYRFYENGADRQAHVFIDAQHIVRRIMFTDERRRDDDGL